MKVLGYARVSTDEQAQQGVSLADQAARIEAYAAAYGLRLVRVETDAGLSGTRLENRPALRRALTALRTGAARGLVVVKLDRLSRTTTDLLQLVARAAREGWELHSLSEHLDTSTPQGRFFVTVIAGLAQMEREQIADRTRFALEELRRQGRRISGKAPFGWRFEGRATVPDAVEQRLLDEILAWRAAGLGVRRIARRLNEAGRLHPRTQRRWYYGTLAAILRTHARRRAAR